MAWMEMDYSSSNCIWYKEIKSSAAKIYDTFDFNFFINTYTILQLGETIFL